MGLFDKLFGRKKPDAPSTSEVARERLTLMLVHDRLKLTPDLLERIKEELLAVISKYVEIEESGVDVELTHTEHSDKLIARMPVRRQRLPFQRDVLEPGMGNPLAAAATLAQIHQPPDGVAPVENAALAAPAQAATAVAAPDSSTSEAVPSTAPAPTGSAAPTAPAQEAAAPSSNSGEATPQVAAESAASVVPEPAASADAGPQAPAPAQEAPALSAGASAAPGQPAAPAAPAAGGATPDETPASAATPTKG